MTIDQLQEEIDKIKAIRPDAGSLEIYLKIEYGHSIIAGKSVSHGHYHKKIKNIVVAYAMKVKTHDEIMHEQLEGYSKTDKEEAKKKPDRIKICV